MEKLSLFFLSLLFAVSATSNKPVSDLYMDLLKFRSLNKILYIAAHPDDENTRLLAYMSLGEKAETAYLSLTRGDGGQNLIGNEYGEKLGVLRTEELLAARSYDKAGQYFSRAVDFGYSKSAKETLKKWGEDEILADMVRVIRKFQPDIIITRFPPDKRGGHGHHTASAMLAVEAFEKSADPSYEREQVQTLGTWQANSLYWNTSYWWIKNIKDSIAKYPDKYFSIDIGQYDELLGKSYNEIGSIARSQHKCQGFGAILERSSRIEYFEHLAGKKIKSTFFEGSDHSWENLIDKNFESELDHLIDHFDFVHTSNNVPALLAIQKRIQEMSPSDIQVAKLNKINKIILDCLGLYLEVTSKDYNFISGDVLDLKISAINRSKKEIQLLDLGFEGRQIAVSKELKPGSDIDFEFQQKIDANVSTPYWLKQPYKDIFTLPDPELILIPKNEPTLKVDLNLEIEGQALNVALPVEYVWRDPSYGERRREVICTPPFTANFESDIVMAKSDQPKDIRINIHAFKDSLTDTLFILPPLGWIVEPHFISLSAMARHEERTVEVQVKPTEEAVDDGFFSLRNQIDDVVFEFEEIVYDHISTQSLIQKSTLKAIKLDAEINKGRVAYINGVVDAVPEAIQQLGFDIDIFEVGELSALDLSQFKSVVLGIRAYNVHPELFNYSKELYEYVEKGGNLIMQYNTASRAIRNHKFGPKPFKLSRKRVTEEDATVEILAPEHQIFNYPNKISQHDFNGWVQERGLYFAGEWDETYTPMIAWNDEGEEPQLGGLIVLEFGKGQFIYTGISFFRELPKGVRGAYRLFANMLSYGPE